MTMMNGVNFFPPCTPNLALEEINFVKKELSENKF